MILSKNDPWPPEVFAFFDRLRPSQTGVPLEDLKQVVESATGWRLTTKQVERQLHHCKLKKSGGLAYVE